MSAQNQTRIHGSLSVGEVVHNFSLRSFLFICKTTDDPELNKLQQHAANATKKAVNAFELLMAGGRSFPDKKRSRYVSNYKVLYHAYSFTDILFTGIKQQMWGIFLLAY